MHVCMESTGGTRDEEFRAAMHGETVLVYSCISLFRVVCSNECRKGSDASATVVMCQVLLSRLLSTTVGMDGYFCYCGHK